MNEATFHQVLETMRLPNGAYLASRSNDYEYVWIRDVCYTVLPYLISSCNRYEKAYQALFDVFKRYKWKINIHTKQKPIYTFEYIHARYSKGLQEMPVEWGHAQNDAIGAFLFGIGEGIRQGKNMIRDEEDREIVQKLVHYLECVQYWKDQDNGMWEEGRELHASSIGACVAGLIAVQLLVDVPDKLIEKGQNALDELLPRESLTKETDLALLSLIYPYQVVTRSMALEILQRVQTVLERTYGCIRYVNDQYYNEGSEAEWCFGFPWMALCYSQLGEQEKVIEYWKKTTQIIPTNGEIPELYIGGTYKPNVNTPLAWAVAMVSLLYQRIKHVEQLPYASSQ